MILFANENLKSNRPVICYGNLVTFDNVSATSENASYPVTNLTNPSLNSRWESASADEQYVTSTFSDTTEIDYVAIAGHDFPTSEAEISIEVEISSVWTEVFPATTLSDYGPVIFRFDPVECDGVRIKIGATVYTPTISVFYAGLILDLERNIYVGHTPINYGLESDLVTGMSENGQFIGRITVGERYQTNVNMNNITPGFYRTYIEPFFVDAVEQPFFFAWRPLKYPNEIAYCWFQANGQMVNELANGMISVSFPVQGIVNGEAITTEQPTARTITIDEDVDDLNLRTLYDTLFPTPTDDTELTVEVESGVVIGSTDTGNPALDIGSWPSGTTILINLDGRIQGAGGAGGDAPDGEGNDGGDAINTSRAVTIDLAGGGEILDGAGGGGADTTNGGGGGAGSTGGAGGAADGGTAGNAGGADTGGTASGNAGDGGDAGLAGDDSDAADGGDSGCTIDDYPLITVINSGSGTIEGCNVNEPSFGSIEMVINSNQEDYNLRTAYDGLAHPTPDSSTVLNVEIESGVVISASDTETPAFDVGTWPAGATITIYVNGTIKGAGGDGGGLGDSAGGDGGVAFHTDFPVTIDFADQGTGADGLIAGGGGGGEGGFTAGTTDIMPAMTSGTTDGVTVTASTNNPSSSDRDGWEAFDNNNGSTTEDIWHSTTADPDKTLEIDFGEETAVSGYKIRSGNSSGHADDGPHDFTFEGSDNGSDWTELDAQSSQTWTTGETKEYNMDSAHVYRYFRLNCSGQGTSDPVVISEMEILGADPINGGGGGAGAIVGAGGDGADTVVEETTENSTDGASSMGERTFVDRTFTVDNSTTVTKIGVDSDVSITGLKVKLFLRNSANNYDIVVDKSVNHTGSGLEYFDLDTPFEVPASGTYYAGGYTPTTIPNARSADRASNGGSGPDLTGTGETITENTANVPAVGVTYGVALDGDSGADGTATTGGVGGDTPNGDGGDLGEDGYDATGTQGGSGAGAGGAAIDGISDVTKLNAGSGTITGDEV